MLNSIIYNTYIHLCPSCLIWHNQWASTAWLYDVEICDNINNPAKYEGQRFCPLFNVKIILGVVIYEQRTEVYGNVIEWGSVKNSLFRTDKF